MAPWYAIVDGTWRFPPEVAARAAAGGDVWIIVFRDPQTHGSVGHVWALHSAWQDATCSLQLTIHDDSTLGAWTRLCADVLAAGDFLRSLAPTGAAGDVKGLRHVKVGEPQAPTMDPPPRCTLQMAAVLRQFVAWRT